MMKKLFLVLLLFWLLVVFSPVRVGAHGPVRERKQAMLEHRMTHGEPRQMPAAKAIAASVKGAWIGIPGLEYDVAALVTDGGYVYAAGEGTTGVRNETGFVDVWDGVRWSRLGTFKRGVYALALSGHDPSTGSGQAASTGVGANSSSGQALYVGGGFPGRVARWDGHQWSTIGQGLDAEVWALAVQETSPVTGRRVLYAGGPFTHAGHVEANHLAVWDTQTHLWDAVGQGVDDTVGAFAVDGRDLYVGGSFKHVFNPRAFRKVPLPPVVSANGVARWNGQWSALGAGINSNGCEQCPQVDAVAVGNGLVYVGGIFNTAGDVPANNIAVWDMDLQKWSALGNGLVGEDEWVFAFALKGNALYVAGWFDYADNVPAKNIARWNIKTRRWSALGEGVDGVKCGVIYGTLAEAVTVRGRQVFVGGCFETPSHGVAVWQN